MAERVVTELVIDASKAESGAKRAEAALDSYGQAAKRAEGASTKVSESIAGTGRSFDSQGEASSRLQRQFESLQRRYDPLFTATREYERAVNTATKAVQQGIGTQERSNELIASAKARLDATRASLAGATGASNAHAGAVRLQAHQVQNLVQQFQDLAVSLGSGQRAFTVLLQQGPQITSAVGGVSNAFKLLVQSINPLTVGIGAALVSVGALALGFVKLEAQKQAMNAIVTGFQVTGRAALASRDQINAMIDEVARIPGVSREAASSAIADFSRIRDLGSASFVDVAKAAAGLAKATGEDFSTAAKKLAQDIPQASATLKKLDDQYGFLTLSQIRAVEGMERVGNRAEAVTTSARLLAQAFEPALKNQTEAQKGADSLAKSWDNLMKSLADSQGVRLAEGLLIRLLGAMNAVASFGSTAPKPALAQGDIEDAIRDLGEFQQRPGIDPNHPGVISRLGAIQNMRAALSIQTRQAANLAGSGSGLFSSEAALFGPAAGTAASAASSGGDTATMAATASAIAGLVDKYDQLNVKRREVEKEIATLSRAEREAADAMLAGNFATVAAVDQWAALAQSVFQAKGALAALKSPLQEATEQARIEWQVAGASIATRDALRARLQAELVDRGKFTDEAERNAYVRQQESAAIARQSAAMNDQAIASEREADRQRKLADAHQRGALAVAEVERQNRIDAATENLLGAAKERVAVAIGKQIDATRELATVQALLNLTQQAEDAERLAVAWAKVAESGDRAALSQAAIDQAGVNLLRQNPNATPGQVSQARVAAGRAQVANSSAQLSQAVDAQRDQLDLARKELELIDALPEIRVRELAQIKAIVELKRLQIPLDSDQGRRYLEQADNLAKVEGAIEAARRQQQLFDQAIIDAGNKIDDALTRPIRGIFDERQVIDWGQTFKSVIADVGAQLLRIYAIRPLIGAGLSGLGFERVARDFGYGGGVQLVQNDSGGFNVVQAAGTAANVNTLFGGPSAGSLITKAALGLDSAFGLGASAVPGGFAAGAEGAASLATIGSEAFSFAEFAPFLAEAAPYLAAAAIAIPILSSIFGKKSVGPGAVGLATFGSGGFGFAGIETDNGGSATTASEFGNNLAAGLDALQRATRASVTPGFQFAIGHNPTDQFTFNLRRQAADGSYPIDQRTDVKGFATFDEALIAGIRKAVEMGDFTPVGEAVTAAIAKSAAKSLDEFDKDIQFGRLYDRGFQPLSALAQAIEPIVAQSEEWTATATRLGLSLDPVTAAIGRQVDALFAQGATLEQVTVALDELGLSGSAFADTALDSARKAEDAAKAAAEANKYWDDIGRRVPAIMASIAEQIGQMEQNAAAANLVVNNGGFADVFTNNAAASEANNASAGASTRALLTDIAAGRQVSGFISQADAASVLARASLLDDATFGAALASGAIVVPQRSFGGGAPAGNPAIQRGSGHLPAAPYVNQHSGGSSIDPFQVMEIGAFGRPTGETRGISFGYNASIGAFEGIFHSNPLTESLRLDQFLANGSISPAQHALAMRQVWTPLRSSGYRAGVADVTGSLSDALSGAIGSLTSPRLTQLDNLYRDFTRGELPGGLAALANVDPGRFLRVIGYRGEALPDESLLSDPLTGGIVGRGLSMFQRTALRALNPNAPFSFINRSDAGTAALSRAIQTYLDPLSTMRADDPRIKGLSYREARKLFPRAGQLRDADADAASVDYSLRQGIDDEADPASRNLINLRRGGGRGTVSFDFSAAARDTSGAVFNFHQDSNDRQDRIIKLLTTLVARQQSSRASGAGAIV